MAVSVTNSNASIIFNTGASQIRISKYANIVVKDIGNNVRIEWGNGTSYVEYVYTDFSAPSGASAATVANAIEAFLDPGSVVAENVLIWGNDGTDDQKVKVNSSGELIISSATDISNIQTNTSNTNGNASTIASAIKTDDATFSPGTSKIMVIGCEYDDTSPDSVDEGDAGTPRMSARREIYIQLRDAAGNERGVNVNASNELGVAVGAGSSNIGRVGSNLIVSVAITRPSNTTQYAVNDVMNNTTDTVPLIFSVALANNGIGWVVSANAITSNGAAGTLPQFDILLFSSTFTIAADNAAFAPTYAQMQTLLGRIRFNQFTNRGGIGSSPGSFETSFPFAAAAGTTNIYGVILLQNTYTPASAETLQFTIGVEQYS